MSLILFRAAASFLKSAASLLVFPARLFVIVFASLCFELFGLLIESAGLLGELVDIGRLGCVFKLFGAVLFALIVPAARLGCRLIVVIIVLLACGKLGLSGNGLLRAYILFPLPAVYGIGVRSAADDGDYCSYDRNGKQNEHCYKLRLPVARAVLERIDEAAVIV